MRIVAGLLKGRKLHPVRTPQIRPTAGRTREAVFSILGKRVVDARVLDLYAGTGVMGIEAMSRGAACALFIDKDPLALRLIRDNLEICRLAGSTRVIRWDITRDLHCLRRFEAKFEIVFLDPPYLENAVERTLDLVRGAECAAPGTVAVAEHGLTERISEETAGWTLKDRRRYGKTLVSFFEYVL